MKPRIKNMLYILSFVFHDKEPFLEEELKEILSKEDYDIEEESIFENGPVSIKNMKIAGRNGCDIVYNSERGNLFVSGKEWEKVNEEFPNIKKILSQGFEIDFDEIIRTYELISDNKIAAGENKNPKEIINNYYKNLDMNKFNEILEEESSNYMIRIVPKGKNPQSFNWYDLIMEPFSGRFYRLRYVYRNKDIQKVNEKAQNLEKTLLKIIEVVEEM